MKKIIVILAVVAFSALAFGDETAPTTTQSGMPTTTGDTMKAGGDTAGKTDDAMAGKKTAKKGKHAKKAKKTTEDKAM